MRSSGDSITRWASATIGGNVERVRGPPSEFPDSKAVRGSGRRIRASLIVRHLECIRIHIRLGAAKQDARRLLFLTASESAGYERDT